MTASDVMTLLGAAALFVATLVIVRWRRKGHAAYVQSLADENVCEHLRPVWKHLQERGAVATRVGQLMPEAPMEIHLQPGFNPQGLFDELRLEPPIFVSERGVLCCKDDLCELHPFA